MGRKDYENISAVIRLTIDPLNERDDQLAEYEWSVAACMANDLADLFAVDNPRFDRSKFLERCGL